MASRYLNRSTPGVYVTEIEAFGSSIVGVATSVPIFIGYTEFAGDPQTGASLYNQPVRLSSMTEFITYFGSAAPPVQFNVAPPPKPAPAPAPAPAGSSSPPLPAGGAMVPFASFNASAAATTTPFAVSSTAFDVNLGTAGASFFSLYYQMRLFFANGGNDCFVVSVGSYWDGQSPAAGPVVPADGWEPAVIAAGDPAEPAANPGLLVGLDAAKYAVGPTMIVIPEAAQLGGTDYGAVVQAMLYQAATLQDRVAILDLPNALTANSYDDLVAAQTMFANAIAPQIAYASYGVAYAPALNTSLVAPTDVSYQALAADPGNDNQSINNILTAQATTLFSGDKLATVQAMIAQAFPTGTASAANAPPYSTDTTAYPTPDGGPTAQWRSDLDKALTSALPALLQIKTQVAAGLSVAPPSAIMAGIWTRSDVLNGVWNAPANFALSSVISPVYNMNDEEQGGFNMPLNGQAINVFRAQPGRGTVVWGARTLDGNSNDYRYIQIRRTLIYIEQSIKTALQSYVFAANDSTTWMTVSSSIASFLTSLWRSGGLMGAKPDEAFTVQCGLGSTMTPQDVLNGYMVVAVTLQMIHPAEFIELTFTQMMNS